MPAGFPEPPFTGFPFRFQFEFVEGRGPLRRRPDLLLDAGNQRDGYNYRRVCLALIALKRAFCSSLNEA